VITSAWVFSTETLWQRVQPSLVSDADIRRMQVAAILRDAQAGRIAPVATSARNPGMVRALRDREIGRPGGARRRRQPQQQQAQQQKPNALFIMGDDIGWMQPSIYHRGLMVGETSNIDRVGNEGNATCGRDFLESGGTTFLTTPQDPRDQARVLINHDK
jgi:hypothetical protein